MSEQKQSRGWLQKCEPYVTGASAICVPIGIVLDQLLLSATPMAVALSLRAFNRQRFEEQVRQDLDMQSRAQQSLVKASGNGQLGKIEATLKNVSADTVTQTKQLKTLRNQLNQTIETQNRGHQSQLTTLVSKTLDAKLTPLDSFLAEHNKSPEDITEEALKTLELIFDRFHRVTKAICSKRHASQTLPSTDRSPVGINEYDVQFVLRALLNIYFEDIREEEVVPGMAGKSSRVDFLLKREKIFIEVKKTSKANNGSRIRDQLFQDLQLYKAHGDCKLLIFFIYDPIEIIHNPKAFENDLSSSSDRIPARVYISSR